MGGRALLRMGSMRRRIGWREELGDDIACGTPRCVVERHQILLHRATGPCRIAIFAPIATGDRALLIGVGLDQTGIDCKALATNQVSRDACLYELARIPDGEYPFGGSARGGHVRTLSDPG